jgi:exopolysaccharide biosynthesis polyprenyl glycosylphosphotransferase
VAGTLPEITTRRAARSLGSATRTNAKTKRLLRILSLLMGDVVALYAALFLTLALRFDGSLGHQLLNTYIVPFTIVFGFWLLIFYIAGIYDLRRLINGTEFWKTFSLAMSVNGLLAIIIFYLVPSFGITPKTNLILLGVIFIGLEFLWRTTFNQYASHSAPLFNVVMIGDGRNADLLSKEIRDNPQLGYALTVVKPGNRAFEALKQLPPDINLIVVPVHIEGVESCRKLLESAMARGINVIDLPHFAEMLLGKIFVDGLKESWMITHALGEPKYYDSLKRGLEACFAAVLGVALLPLMLLIAIAIKLNSKGPIIYSQKRVGKYGKVFTLYKFRSMRVDAEKAGAQWKASGTSDPRLTFVGRFLVRCHLDELPQLWNIFCGNLSFVGPRPERPEFVTTLKQEIPFFETRHIVLPGITGWAQINYRYGSSVDDAARKLEYDISYIKNRSLPFDVAIIVKTLKSFFVSQQ